MAGLIDASQHFRSPNTRQTFLLVNEWNFMNGYPPETEPLHAAGPPDNPDEPIELITDVTEDADDTENCHCCKRRR